MRTRIEPTAASASKSAGGEAEPDCTLVYTGTLYRRRKGSSIALVNEPPPKPAPQGPSRQAIMLALAHKLQQAIDTGKVKDRAEVARRLGVTRARVTQIIDLALMPVAEQERVLGAHPLSAESADDIGGPDSHLGMLSRSTLTTPADGRTCNPEPSG